jgi:hypothetical protein
MYIRQLCRICIESGLFDSCNPGLLLLGSERQNHKNTDFKVKCVLQLSGGVEHRNHAPPTARPSPSSKSICEFYVTELQKQLWQCKECLKNKAKVGVGQTF